LDILGNALGLGSLADDPNTAGLSISFTDENNPYTGRSSRTQFGMARANSSWFWTRAREDGDLDSVPQMQLDSRNRLLLYDPAQPTAPRIILDPAGHSYITPQGDIGMGEFQAAPQL
jgi:hypothetical protein